MANQTGLATFEELCRALRAKERELSELDLMLADYYAEHPRLIHELRWLLVRLRNLEEAASGLSKP